MRFTKQKLLLFAALFFVLFSFAYTAPARARGLVPCGGYKDDGTPENPCTVADAFALVARVTNWLIALAGVYAVYEVVNGGFWLAISMGNEEAITKEKSRISSAIVGMVMVFFAYMLINTAVNYILLGGIGYQKGYEDCQIKLSDPLTYLTIDAAKVSKCHKQ